jgi:hypothetical protein
VISRRQFIALTSLGTVGGAGVLVACTGGGAGIDMSELTVVQRFPQMLVPGEVRAPISLANRDGVLTVEQAAAIPDLLTGSLVNAETGAIVASGLSASKHSAGLAAPYWPFRFTVDQPGIYSLLIDDVSDTGAAVQVSPREQVLVPLVGDVLPPFDTPTFDDARGIDPICTQRPDPCPLHDVTLTEALALGKPVVYLVGTPAYCATGTCAPALEGVLKVRDQVGDAITFVHSEIYTDDSLATVAPAVTALNMTYEPALFITNAQGVLVDRLDAVFDEVEVRESLEANSLVN